MHGRAGAGPKRGAAGPQPVRRADRLASVARGCAARRACRSQLCAARRTSAAFGRAKVGRSRCRLSPGPCMAPGGDRPVVQGDLPRADPGGALRSVRPEQPMHGAGCSGRTDRGRRPHPELHIGGPGQPPLIGHLPSLENVADVASLDLRRHAMGQHLLRQPVEQIGRGLLRPGRNVAQPDRAEVMGAPPPASFPARR